MGDSRLLGEGRRREEVGRCDEGAEDERKSLPASSNATRQSSDS